MKIIKTVVVSTISLGIAMSAAALSAGPSLAAQKLDSPERKSAIETPRLPITGKQTCASKRLTLPDGVNTDTGLTITFNLGKAKPVALLFSTEIAVFAGNSVNLLYSIDGGTPVPIGPEFFADDTMFTTRTAFGVVNAPFNGGKILTAGKHTITPILDAIGAGGGVAFFRCFTVLNTGT